MSLKNLIVVACLSVLTVVFFGCVDLPSESPEFPDFRTQTRFIQADASLGAAQVMVDGSSVGTVDFQGATGYSDLPAGERDLTVQGTADTTAIALEADGKTTVIVFPKVTPTQSRFRNFRERRTFDALPDTAGQVRFISANIGAGTGEVSYDVLNAADNSVVADDLLFRDNSGYLNLPAGSYSFVVAVHGTTDPLATLNVTVSNGQRHTAVIFGDQATLAFSSFQDD